MKFRNIESFTYINAVKNGNKKRLLSTEHYVEKFVSLITIKKFIPKPNLASHDILKPSTNMCDIRKELKRAPWNYNWLFQKSHISSMPQNPSKSSEKYNFTHYLENHATETIITSEIT